MIALRPIHGNFGSMKVTIREGRKIPEQILKLLDVKSMLKNGEIREEVEEVKKEKSIPMSKKDGR